MFRSARIVAPLVGYITFSLVLDGRGYAPTWQGSASMMSFAAVAASRATRFSAVVPASSTLPLAVGNNRAPATIAALATTGKLPGARLFPTANGNVDDAGTTALN